MTTELTLGPIGNVFYFVDELEEAVAWYAARLGREPVLHGGALVAFEVSGVRLTLHESDTYNTPGPAGVSVYWTVPDVDSVVTDWTAHGAVAHRGPKTVFTGERLCQLLDPFGNLFSVRQAPSESTNNQPDAPS
jgi:predicted enzyme related to lactoylglutathione lyase